MIDIPHCDKLIGQRGFSDKPIMPPPSESNSNVIQFELTRGCSHGRCTFCDMYGAPDYKEKSLDEFKEHVDSVLEIIPRENCIDRIFIGSGDALNVETEKLLKIIRYSLVALRDKNGQDPKRLSIYGNTKNILKQGRGGMKYLNCGGTCGGTCSKNFFDTRLGLEVVYWGLESGNDEVLKIAGKGYTSDEASRAGSILEDVSHLRTSVMVMPGLGGISHFDEHINDTVEILNETRPKWVTFMGLDIKANTPYETWINKQEKLNKNRRLTPKEITEQTAQMIERLDFSTTVGVHGNDVHNSENKSCYNPKSFGAKEIDDLWDARDLARKLRA